VCNRTGPRACPHRWKTLRASPPRYGPRPPAGKLIDPFAGVIDAWLRVEVRLQAFTIFERLAQEPYRFSGSYETVKRYVRVRRPEIAHELGIREQVEQMHRRYEVLPGSQAQVDWGEESPIETPEGPVKVYSFHMVLSHSRDPFCRYTVSQDLATFWACHDEAFGHFYDQVCNAGEGEPAHSHMKRALRGWERWAGRCNGGCPPGPWPGRWGAPGTCATP